MTFANHAPEFITEAGLGDGGPAGLAAVDPDTDRSVTGLDISKLRRRLYAFDRYGQRRIYWRRLPRGKCEQA